MREHPLLVGTVALDFLHEGPLGAGRAPATLRWGGVMNNVACALGARGTRPVFITADYTGELRTAVEAHLTTNGAVWRPAPVRSPLPVFHAELVDGSVSAMHFIGQEALDALTPRAVGEHVVAHVAESAVVASGTDSHADNLAWLRRTAAEAGKPFWLLSADPEEVSKLVPGSRADLVALNHRELCLWAGRDLPDHRETAAAARELAGDGHVVVTLGAEGSLAVGPGIDGVVVHRVERPLRDVVTVGAGDVHFAALLEARVAGVPWAQALAGAAELTAAYLAQPATDRPYDCLRPGNGQG
ncbi:PfkB family carbohydrate kinase [Actinokineospora bangkokensis]|uniref:Carbohydrate kinase PfkB domain-containing protein n=1 Tax=Actinokineospora bangkokensis TaxID=1193682 RepID=A0A1Q9LJU9_9PSEU|nr:carbohydrate kinase family protein [Actinokineospora bangkokensis]OLR92321.1 hypothetical protein BJP25_23190 [Actinokineospora bangkokensis]